MVAWEECCGNIRDLFKEALLVSELVWVVCASNDVLLRGRLSASFFVFLGLFLGLSLVVVLVVVLVVIYE